ncbi:MAG: DinB family protein [Candidatus Eisenbacteria bacterium]|uniref:DinB family protein n=1 Tax=Eiseniibacteriota bacterium TaxID=2212470 RepID=A0A948W7Q8_UNCEI|nr:DinB family protein [Candidatus Eisenbacteria bacterium]MBU1947903.1 DinB family protein [Candidatus Eisenbacteria bacterium]MBU2691901.1 DinB family protein [Candidatus Eisenbacteria bacterium]
MEFEHLVSQMVDNAQRIRALAEPVSMEQARWRPDPESWSILEVVNHMHDVEHADFRTFLDLALHRPNERRPRISPEAWVTERRYNERDLTESLQGYLAAREESVAWLRTLASPDWEAVYPAPWGPIKSGDVFAAWVAHDVLHMRQLVKLHWAFTIREVGPFSTDYAGDW